MIDFQVNSAFLILFFFPQYFYDKNVQCGGFWRIFSFQGLKTENSFVLKKAGSLAITQIIHQGTLHIYTFIPRQIL